MPDLKFTPLHVQKPGTIAEILKICYAESKWPNLSLFTKILLDGKDTKSLSRIKNKRGKPLV